MFACLLLTAGSLGDKLGRKGILTVGLALFGTFSALAAFSTSAAHADRRPGLMGIGGACIYPSTLSILTNTFHDDRERGRAIGIWAGVSGLGVAIGPLAGGLLVEHFWWGSVFLVNVPICALAIVAGHFFVPTTTRDPDHALDPSGAVLLDRRPDGLLFAIIEVPDRGCRRPRGGRQRSLVGLVFLAAFGWWETHYEHPMLDLRFFQNPRFSAASATITLTFFALYGSTFLLTQYFQFVLAVLAAQGGDADRAGGGRDHGHGAAGTQARRAHRHQARRRDRPVDRRHGPAAVLGRAGDVVAGRRRRRCACCSASAWGCVMAPATESIMGSLPKAKAGVGSAVNDTTRQAGGALGVAVIGSVFAATYHHVDRGPRRAARTCRADGARLDRLGARGGHPLRTPERRSPQPSTTRPARPSSAACRWRHGSGAAVMVCAVVVAYKYLPARSERAVRTDVELADDSRLAASLDDGMLT